ncbi:MAG: protein-L-isoaspartate(D-aspartate) O-methyltransferase [Bacteroidales bacterium]|nr:protein-L-isoaspartate(D-aspartate) O-methyltransferase [Bacteroidales bacterium]
MQEDNFFQKGKRQQLVKLLAQEGISDKRILKVMVELPRHFFINPTYADHAYDNKPLPIDKDQTISQPYTVAFQTQLLSIEQGDKVLEIGTGSGYQAAVLLKLGAKVYSIERHKVLFEKTKQLFDELGLKAHLFYGDGFKGQPLFAPFDKILITAAAPSVPDELLKQLKVGGVLVVPIDNGKLQTMTSFKKIDATNFEVKKHGQFSFVPMLEGKE